jgi:hypothetical protein
MEVILLLSAVTAIISFDISESAVFAPVRNWLQFHVPFLGKLASCGFCTGHWVALALTLVYQPRLLLLWEPLDLVITSLVIAWLSAFQWAALCLLTSRAGR